LPVVAGGDNVVGADRASLEAEVVGDEVAARVGEVGDVRGNALVETDRAAG